MAGKKKNDLCQKTRSSLPPRFAREEKTLRKNGCDRHNGREMPTIHNDETAGYDKLDEVERRVRSGSDRSSLPEKVWTDGSVHAPEDRQSLLDSR